MTLTDLGALGELIGGLAVILSVLYLALQIRQGLVGYRSVITQEVTNHFSRIQFDIARDPELSALWYQSGGRPDALSANDINRLEGIFSSYMIGFENLYFQHTNGMLDDEAWVARRNIMAMMLTNPVARDWWPRLGRKMHPASFVKEVDAAINGDT